MSLYHSDPKVDRRPVDCAVIERDTNYGNRIRDVPTSAGVDVDCLKY